MMMPAQYRPARGFLNGSQAELARRIGVAPNTVGDIEQQRRSSRPATVAALEKGLTGAGIAFSADRRSLMWVAMGQGLLDVTKAFHI